MTKYSLDVTNQFKKDFKRCIKRGLPIAKIQEAMRLLEADGFLPAQFRPHKLSGDLIGKWECHINSRNSDWLMVWTQNLTSLGVKHSQVWEQNTHKFGSKLLISLEVNCS